MRVWLIVYLKKCVLYVMIYGIHIYIYCIWYTVSTTHTHTHTNTHKSHTAPSNYQSWQAASTVRLWCRWPPWRIRWWRQQCSESQRLAVWGRRRLAARLLTLWSKQTHTSQTFFIVNWPPFSINNVVLEQRSTSCKLHRFFFFCGL